MEAKAPDKIYRNTDKTGYVCWSETEFVKPYSATAYIRNDALLEWVKKQIKDYADSLPEEIGWDDALKAVINKINSL